MFDIALSLAFDYRLFYSVVSVFKAQLQFNIDPNTEKGIATVNISIIYWVYAYLRG